MTVRDKLPWRRIETEHQLDDRAQRLSEILVNRVTASFIGQADRPAEPVEVGIGPLPRGQDLEDWLGRVGIASENLLQLEEPVVSFSYQFDAESSLDASREKHEPANNGWSWVPTKNLTIVFSAIHSQVEARYAELYGE